MDWLLYIAIVVVSSLISIALAPKPPKQKPYALEDFDLPTAERDRALPWVFGTRTITDPNFIWYGDLEVATKTKDKVKTRLYGMGFVLEICIGPVDSVTRILYGDKECWAGNVTASEQIFIDQLGLYGGREKDGGIYGYMDLQFGEPTQAVNDYLLEHLGSPLTAYRDSLTFVGRHMWLAANSPYVKAITPTVKAILAGWPAETPWYPETAEIRNSAAVTALSFDRYVQGQEGGPALEYLWDMDLLLDSTGDLVPNIGALGSSAAKDLTFARNAGATMFPTLEAGIVNNTASTASSKTEYSAAHRSRLICTDFAVTSITAPFWAGHWGKHYNDRLLYGAPILCAVASSSSYTFTGAPTLSTRWSGYSYTTALLQMTVGDDSGSAAMHRWVSNDRVIIEGQTHFIAVWFQPSASPGGFDFLVYVDGAAVAFTKTVTGTATTISYTPPSGTYTGFGIGAGDGTVQDGWTTTQLDKFFLHSGSLTAAQILEMWQRGTCLLYTSPSPRD